MFKDLYPLSDYTTGYMNGGDDNSGSGVFCDHGNHTQANTGSQTNIIITTMVMAVELLIMFMDVLLESIVGVVFFTLTM